ncbi:YqaJ viral recombinase family protein [Candidatus Pacearchaeota archaeon]|nr:YqaJ viral recombinase family protein [Candidatus Pacearchaeota archaeon]
MGPIVHNMEQRSPEWFAARLGKITASNMDKVMAKGAGKTRAAYLDNKFLEHKYGHRFESNVNTYDMKWGTEHEDEAISLYEDHQMCVVQRVGFVEMNKWVGASPDGLIDLDGGCEAKCPKASTHRERIKTGVIKGYDWQVYGNMMVTGRKWWELFSYHPDFHGNGFDDRLVIVRYKRDEKKIDELKYECDRFARDLKIIIERISA